MLSFFFMEIEVMLEYNLFYVVRSYTLIISESKVGQHYFTRSYSIFSCMIYNVCSNYILVWYIFIGAQRMLLQFLQIVLVGKVVGGEEGCDFICLSSRMFAVAFPFFCLLNRTNKSCSFVCFFLYRIWLRSILRSEVIEFNGFLNLISSSTSMGILYNLLTGDERVYVTSKIILWDFEIHIKEGHKSMSCSYYDGIWSLPSSPTCGVCFFLPGKILSYHS